MTWRYGIVKRTLDDGPVYGLHELYFTDGMLQSWTENPFWTEQDKADFYSTLDKLEARFTHEGYMADWAFGYTAEEYAKTLKMMRDDLKLPLLDEDEQLRKWDEP